MLNMQKVKFLLLNNSKYARGYAEEENLALKS